MTLRYVYSGAAGTGTGADWTNAFTTVAAAVTAANVSNDTVYVAHDHAESSAGAISFTKTGSGILPVLCVNRSGSVPPVSADLRTTGSVESTGSTVGVTANLYIYGIVLKGSTAVNVGTGASQLTLKNCALNKTGTGSGSATAIAVGLVGGTTDSFIVLDNTTMQFGHTSDSVKFGAGYIYWRDTPTAILGATLPTTLFAPAASAGADIPIKGVDLSAITGTIVGAASSGRRIIIENCKTNASATIAATPTSPGSAETYLIRSDSGSTNYRQEHISYAGTQTVETTIVLTGGASDGTTPISWKIVTTANSKWSTPFECIPIAAWCETVGSVTVTLQGIWGGGAVPNNDEIWMLVEYMGDGSYPQSSFATTNKADILATAGGIAAGAGTWGGSTTKFKLTKTVVTAKKGFIYLYVKAAKVSSTFYVDPFPVLS